MPRTHQDLPENAPQWSDWHERELGFEDKPTHIVCRVCEKMLPATRLFYRRKATGLRFHTKCVTCIACDPYRRSAKGFTSLVTNDPTIPDVFKKHALDELPERKRQALRLARHKTLTSRFIAEWTLVRKIIVYRKHMLVRNIDASRHRSRTGVHSGLHAAMEYSPAVARYIEALLATYAHIIGRLLRLRDWQDTIGDHYPPPYWSTAMATCAAAMQRGETALPHNAVLTINPWMLATRQERDKVRSADPDRAYPPDGYWTAVLAAREQSGRLRVHVYPWRYPEDDTPPQDQSPDWLLAFNGYEKPKGNP